ncbi:MAG: glycosyltransferase family 2 protein [Candidatus Delongbacteria bacterium]
MKLTIIIPHYNTPNLLKKLLDSTPDKNNIEVLVIDDKSNKFLDIYDEIQSDYSHRVKFLKNETANKGAGTCRNIGLDFAKGEWILFADSDDFFVENFYEKIEPFFASEYDVVIFTPTSMYADSGELSERHKFYKDLIDKYLDRKTLERELKLKYVYFVVWSKLIKRSLIEKNEIRFDEVIAKNDVMFSAKVSYFMKKFLVSEEIIYCVTRSEGSLTVRTNEEVFYSRLNVEIDHYKYLKDRLSRKEFMLLGLSGRASLFDAVFRYKFGIKKTYEVIKKLKKNDVKILTFDLLNPVYIFKKIKSYFNIHHSDKKYFKK